MTYKSEIYKKILIDGHLNIPVISISIYIFFQNYFSHSFR